jgi:hypothetical protein
MQNATAHETLRRWQAGDRTTNNDIRPGKRMEAADCGQPA